MVEQAFQDERKLTEELTRDMTRQYRSAQEELTTRVCYYFNKFMKNRFWLSILDRLSRGNNHEFKGYTQFKLMVN